MAKIARIASKGLKKGPSGKLVMWVRGGKKKKCKFCQSEEATED